VILFVLIRLGRHGFSFRIFGIDTLAARSEAQTQRTDHEQQEQFFHGHSVNAVALFGQARYEGGMTNYVTDVAIVGAGPSGLFMVFQAGFLGYKSVVLDAQPQIGGQLSALYPEKPIYDVPGCPGILAGQLVKNLEAQAAPFEPTYLLGEAATTCHKVDTGFVLTRAGGDTVTAKVVVVAGGGGMFTPRKPPRLEGLETFEATGDVMYAITNKAALAGKNVVLAGGGDSAVDWAVELAKTAAHVHVVHRRNDFRAADASVAEMKALVEEGKVTLHTPMQMTALEGNDRLKRVVVADLDGKTQNIDTDALVCCFGLVPNVGPLESWGLGLAKGVIAVDRTTMETQIPGILCLGDMADYEGKVALILTGFAECAVAGRRIQSIINPERTAKVQYSTSKGAAIAPGGTGSGA
jgi:thioredoxin reductase (NADPH)